MAYGLWPSRHLRARLTTSGRKAGGRAARFRVGRSGGRHIGIRRGEKRRIACPRRAGRKAADCMFRGLGEICRRLYRQIVCSDLIAAKAQLSEVQRTGGMYRKVQSAPSLPWYSYNLPHLSHSARTYNLPRFSHHLRGMPSAAFGPSLRCVQSGTLRGTLNRCRFWAASWRNAPQWGKVSAS